MERKSVTKVLGTANRYEAHWVGKSLLVKLSAKGLMPCLNMESAFERDPREIEPPIHRFVFFVEDYCLTAVKEIDATITFPNTTFADSVVVLDAEGEHVVPVKDANAELMPTKKMGEQEDFIVYAKLPKPDKGHHFCIVVPEGTIVTADRYRAFGPASKEDCDDFVLKNCSSAVPAKPDYLRGGEIPWPLEK